MTMNTYEGQFVRARGDLDANDLKIYADLDERAKNIAGFDVPDLLKVMGFDNESGYNQAADRITQSLDGADLNAMWREFQRSIQLLNQWRDPFIRFLSYMVNRPVDRVMYPTDHDFEEASEFGEPVGIRLGAPFSLGFDFKWYDLAIRYTWMFLAEADSEQIRALNSSALEADVRLQFNKILKGILNNVSRTATVNDGLTAINVYPLYNADGFVPPAYKGTTFAGSHTHYVASGAGTVDAGDVQQMITLLGEHGYRVTEGYRLILLVNPAQGATIRTFVNGTGGAIYSFIPSAGYGGGVFLPANSGIVARPAETGIPGMNVIGTYGPFTVVEEDMVPAGYMIAFATGGELGFGNVVGIREHARLGLRGLQLLAGNQQGYPLTDSFYRHGFGTGVRHRGGAAVMQITAGAFSIPTGYA